MITAYNGSSRCATLNWQSLGLGNVMTTNLGTTPVMVLDTVIALSSTTAAASVGLLPGTYIQIDSEVMLVTSINANNNSLITVIRGQENTAIRPHVASSTVNIYGMLCSAGDSYTLGVTAGGPVVPSTRLYPLRSRYEAFYTPTVIGDYQVHSVLAVGSGLDATFYDDQELTIPKSTIWEPVINFSVSDTEIGFYGDNPRSEGVLNLSDRLSFSARWGGLLQLDETFSDTSAQVIFSKPLTSEPNLN